MVDSTITLGLLNISSAVTYAGFGKICDFYPYPRVILWSSLVATLSAALLWGFASKVAVLFVFALLYGGAVCRVQHLIVLTNIIDASTE